MNQQLIISEVQYRDIEHEGYLSTLRQQVTATAELQGKQHGEKNMPKTMDEFRTMVLNFIEVTIQGALNVNQQKYLPISGMGIAKLIEAAATKRELEIQNKIHDDEHALEKARNEAKRLQPDVKLMQTRKLVLVGLTFIACTEGAASYTPFRHANFSVLLAVLASIGVAIGVGAAAHHLGGWIKQAKNWAQTVLRYLLSMTLAVAGFGYLGILRARSYNHTFNPSTNAREVTAHNQSTASAAAIAAISIFLFWIALYISKKYFRTDEERLREHAYQEKCGEVGTLEQGIVEKNKEITLVRMTKNTEIAIALKRWEYAYSAECGLITFAQEAAELYKQKNIRYRTDGICPECFAVKIEFNFITFFKPTKNQ
jgi:hypothetical protein